MSVIETALRAARDLERATAPCALVGGLAVSTRAEPRNTRDVDFVVAAADDADAERIVRSLASFGYRVVAVLEQEVTGRLSTVRLRRGDELALVDLLFASSGVEGEIVREAEPLDVGSGVLLPVARTGHLIAMKLLSRDDVGRPQDRVDLAALVGAASDEELERARAACRQIEARGYARERDLGAALEEALATWRRVP